MPIPLPAPPEILPPPHTDRIVRWHPADYAEIQRVAAEMGISANRLIRIAVLRWLAHRKAVEAAGRKAGTTPEASGGCVEAVPAASASEGYDNETREWLYG